jgi:hypothetical protein
MVDGNDSIIKLEFNKKLVKIEGEIKVEKNKIIFNYPWIISVVNRHLIEFFHIDEPSKKYEFNIKEGNLSAFLLNL